MVSISFEEKIADGSTHRNTIDNIKRRSVTERSDTTDADSRVGTGLSVGGDLYA